MERRRLGNTDLQVSAIALGTAAFGGEMVDSAPEQKDADAVVSVALDAGVNFFDTAQLYSEGRSEEMLGQALRGRRDKAIIATKFREFGAWNRDEIIDRLKASLRRLATDHVDLYLIHWPKHNLNVADVEIMVEAFEAAIRQGLARATGVSNFRMNHLSLLTPAARELLAANQIEYSLLWRQYDVEGATEFCRANGISCLAYSPSAYGFLTGRYTREQPPMEGWAAGMRWAKPPFYARAMELVDKLKAVAADLGRTPAQVALNWVIAREGMAAALVGTHRIENLRQNLGAAGWKLPAEAAAELDRASLEFQRWQDERRGK